mmetsp:Transcript_29325/g.93538  ORF Transcript_29325/g.93538 Transcript_29325/m.93538 type:complete len:219 (+) Transcript_29325:219-875(+)
MSLRQRPSRLSGHRSWTVSLSGLLMDLAATPWTSWRAEQLAALPLDRSVPATYATSPRARRCPRAPTPWSRSKTPGKLGRGVLWRSTSLLPARAVPTSGRSAPTPSEGIWCFEAARRSAQRRWAPWRLWALPRWRYTGGHAWRSSPLAMSSWTWPWPSPGTIAVGRSSIATGQCCRPWFRKQARSRSILVSSRTSLATSASVLPLRWPLQTSSSRQAV